MNKHFPVCAPLGRLYDPLPQLAQRVHRALATKEKTVWTDANGYVFATPTVLAPFSPHATVGIYGRQTPLPAIEIALRRALRERASSWIVDWRVQLPITPCGEVEMLHLLPPHRRRRRTREGAAAVMLPIILAAKNGQPRM
jgi:hypothetical protein